MLSKEVILRTDKAHVWHPFTQSSDYKQNDMPVITRGKGIFIYDSDGNRYYDTVSSWWVNTLGHCNPRIVRAARRQLKMLEHVIFAGFTHPAAVELAGRLASFLPEGLSRMFFSDDGSTAVEVALKMAFQYFQNTGKIKKTKFAALNLAYHGDTMGAVSAGGIDLYHKIYKPLTFSVMRAAAPDCSLCPFRKSEYTLDAESNGCGIECFKSMEEILSSGGDEIAAVIVEPLVLASGGMKVYPAGYLRKLREKTAGLDVLLILDEVATGFGRTGTMFAFEQAGIVPDIVCLSKGLTGGFLPLSLTVAKEWIYKSFEGEYNGATFFHGHSYTGNPVACSAAVESLKIIREKNLPYSRKNIMDYFHDKLHSLSDYGFTGDIRYKGFIGAIDLVKNRERRETLDPDKRTGFRVYLESLKEGVILRPLGDTIYWFLPLITGISDIDSIFSRSLNAIRRGMLD